MAKDITKIKNAVLEYRANDAEYQAIKKKAANAPKATENTTTKGVADNTATPTSDVSKVSDTAKSLSKVIPVVDKVKSVVSQNKPSLASVVTGGNAKVTNIGDMLRTAFDSKNASKANQEIPTLKDDNALINYYENLPKANILQRATSFEKNNAYNQKQALAKQYQEAKDRTIPTLLQSHNISTNDLNKQARMSNVGDTFSLLGMPGGSAFGNSSAYGIEKYLKDNGLNDTDAKYVADYLKRNASEQTNEKIVETTGKNLGTKTLGTIASVPVKGIASLSDNADKLVDYLQGNPISTDNSQASRVYNLAQNMRNESSKDLGELGQLAYGVGTSIGDMAFAMLLGQATGVGSTLSSGMLASEKAADVMNEGVERGLNPDEIIKEGVASGITTALTEKVPMGRFEKVAQSGFKSKTLLGKIGELAGKYAASFFPEATQEALENVADTLADGIIAGDNSKFNASIQAYMNQGLSHDEAEAQALVDKGKEVLQDFLAGGLAGGFVGAGNAVINGWNINANNDNNATPNGEASANNASNAESVLATNEEIENLANDIFGAENPTIVPTTQEVAPNAEPNAENGSVMTDEDLVAQFTQARQELLNEINSDDALTSLSAMNELSELDEMMQQVHPELYDENNRYMAESAGLNNPTLTANIDEIAPTQTENNVPKSSRFRPSQYVTNSILNNPTYQQNENFIKAVEEGIARGDFDVETQTEAWQNQQAAKNLETDYDGTVRELLSSKGYDGVKTTESMMVLDDLLAEGNETGDFTKSLKWINHNKGKFGDAAHALQALAKYTRTASSALMKTETMADAKAKHVKEKYKSGAKNFVEQIKEDTKGLSDFNEIKDIVANKIKSSDGKLFKNFDDAKIDYLTSMLLRGESKASMQNAILRNFATGAFEISADDIKAINALYQEINNNPNPNSKEVHDLEGQAFDILSKYLGEGNFMEKWNAWRYLAMLGNPRTHFRNMFGNGIFGSVTNLKDAIAAAIEVASGTEDRTKSVISRFNEADSALLNGGKDDFDTNVYAQAVGDKYNMERGLKQHQKVFKDSNIVGKALNKASRFNSDMLTREDTNAMKRKYARALAGYLKSNGKNASIFSSDSESDIKFLEKARAYALNEAEIATFHEDSKLADVLNQWSKAAAESDNPAVNALNFMLESIIPFKKTPVNIAKQGIWEYSPASIGKFIGKLSSNAYNNSKGIDTKYNPSEIINDFAKGLTGSGIMALGMLLAKKGFLKGSNVDDADKLLDEQAYSINIGNHSFTVDWSAPASLPLFVGVELYNALTNQDDFTLMDALGNISQPMVEMSMMQGLRDALKNVAYADANSTLPVMGVSLGLGYISQGVPTLAGQIARTIDPTRRNSYVTGQKSGTLSDTAIRSGEKLLNKIPFLSMLSEPYLDTITGEEQENEDLGIGMLGRGIQNMVLPGYYSKTGGESEMKQELARLEKFGANDDSIPSVIPNSAKKSADGEYLSPKEYTKAQSTMGRINKKNLTELQDTQTYKDSTDAQKAMITDKINNYSKQLFNKEMYGKDFSDGTIKKYDDIYKEGGMDALAKFIKSDVAYKESLNDLGLEGGSLAKEVYQSEGKKGLQTLKEAADKASSLYGADSITSTEYKDYSHGFMDDFNDSVKYRTILENNDLSNSALNRGYVEEYGEDIIPMLKEAEDAIKTVQRGVDKYNDAEYFNPNKKMIDIYRDKGKDGVELYADIYLKDDIDEKPDKRGLKDTVPYLASLDLSDADKGYYLYQFLQPNKATAKYITTPLEQGKTPDYAGLYRSYINNKTYHDRVIAYLRQQN